MPGDLISFFDSTEGRSFLHSVLTKLSVSSSDELIDKAMSYNAVFGKCKIIADILVYGGISMWSGNYNSQYFLHPMTINAQNQPPFIPKLLSPLGTNQPAQPIFEWDELSKDITGFRFQLADNTNFTPTIVDTFTSNKSYLLVHLYRQVTLITGGC